MKKLAFIFLLLVGISVLWQCYGFNICRKIKIRGYIFTAEIAASSIEKAKGLGYRDNMPQDYGMLFVFKKKERYSFWMKGMRFPLDFVWIEENRVVEITQKVPVATGDNLSICRPGVPVDKALELNAGVVEKFGISVGDTVTFVE